VVGVKASQNFTRGNTPIQNDTIVLPLRLSETVVDPFTELVREGVRRMLAEALNAATWPLFTQQLTLVSPSRDIAAQTTAGQYWHPVVSM
jgi:hypothetical protein